LGNSEIRKSLQTRDWQKAHNLVRAWEEAAALPTPTNSGDPITLAHAWDRFIADLESRKLQESTVRKYRQLRKQLELFATTRGARFLSQVDITFLDEFRAWWRDGNRSSAKKLERLRAFFRFAQKRRWAVENPALELRSPKFDLCPTMPFTQQEVLKILAAVDSFIESSARNGIENARRIRALVLLLRYTGMRICDVVGLNTDRISNNRVFLYTQKTGVPVQTLLPEFVVKCLQSTPQKTGKFWFWSGVGKLDSAVRSWQARLKKLFQIAGVPSGHAHRFRDTFGVELLLAGVPIERVSILLGHRSVRITEKHYNPWVRSRQEQLEADIERALAHDPVALIESKGTQKVRSENEVLN
jgi:integrase/recombinase XerD